MARCAPTNPLLPSRRARWLPSPAFVWRSRGDFSAAESVVALLVRA